VLGPAGNVPPRQSNPAAVDEERARGRVQQAGFPRAVPADDDDELSLLQGEIDLPQGPHLVGCPRMERLEDAMDLEHSHFAPDAGRQAPDASGIVCQTASRFASLPVPPLLASGVWRLASALPAGGACR